MIKDNLTRYRVKAGLSQSDLAKQVHCTQQMIYLCESGRKTPSLQLAAEISKVVGCTIDDLIKE